MKSIVEGTQSPEDTVILDAHAQNQNPKTRKAKVYRAKGYIDTPLLRDERTATQKISKNTKAEPGAGGSLSGGRDQEDHGLNPAPGK
jgi:hypothetical protein